MLRKPFDGVHAITQKFGERPDYYKQFGFAGHEGVDYGMVVGTSIVSCEKGKVVRRNDVKSGAYGIYIVVWHEALNLATWYCHLSENKVTIGTQVEKGQQIALSGNTGNTSGPHLHLNLCKTDENGYRIDQDNGYKGFIDPQPYIETGTTTECSPLCQEIINSLRGERDGNWNLYQEEKKAHTETLALLKACQKEKEAYQRSITEWARLLNVSPTTEAVGVAINDLMTKEDALRKCTTSLGESKAELEDANKTNEQIIQENTLLKTNNGKIADELTVCQTQKGEYYNDLQKCQGNQPPDTDQSKIACIIGCLFKPSKGKEENDTTNTNS